MSWNNAPSSLHTGLKQERTYRQNHNAVRERPQGNHSECQCQGGRDATAAAEHLRDVPKDNCADNRTNVVKDRNIGNRAAGSTARRLEEIRVKVLRAV